MITEAEHRIIYEIIDRFGGEEKGILREKILSLLKKHERKILNKIYKFIKDYDTSENKLEG